MIIAFHPAYIPGRGTAYITAAMRRKNYDLDNGSLLENKDPYTGYYSAEAFLLDLEWILKDPDADLIVIRRVKE